MNTVSKRSLATRIRERFQYGLAIQEMLDTLQRRVGILVCPYFVVAEGLRGEFTSGDDSAGSFDIRFLGDADIESLAEIRTRPLPLATLRKTLSTSKCLGIFVDGRLAGYTWSRFDRIPIPNCMRPLMELEKDEAYLFDAFVSRDVRGLRLAPIVRQHLYRELALLGRPRLYSVTLAFNRSSRRFKARLGAKELELRLLLGISGWRAIDIRLKTLEGKVQAPTFQLLRLKTGLPKGSEIDEASPP